MEILPFADDHVEGAAALLAQRHAAHRAAEPLLPERSDLAAEIEKERQDGSGAVALEGGAVVGYLLGQERENFMGKHVWSHVAGHAVREPELARDRVGEASVQPGGDTERLGVLGRQGKGPLVDVDGPHVSRRTAECQCGREHAVAAAEVEQGALTHRRLGLP